MVKGNSSGNEEKVFVRARLPKPGEVVGMVDQRVGGSRMIVKCSDGKARNCRVPGRFRRGLWIREGDYILVKPWEFDDSKGDIYYKYSQSEIFQLKEKGFMEKIDDQL